MKKCYLYIIRKHYKTVLSILRQQILAQRKQFPRDMFFLAKLQLICDKIYLPAPQQPILHMNQNLFALKNISPRQQILHAKQHFMHNKTYLDLLDKEHTFFKVIFFKKVNQYYRQSI